MCRVTTGVLGSATRSADFADPTPERRLLRWVIPIAVFLASRVVDTALLVSATKRQVQLTADNFPFFMARDFPSAPGYLDLITTWDGQFYKAIALDGYLDPDPSDPQAAGRELTWQFPPGFPMLVRALMWLTGGEFALVAMLLNVALGSLAMVVLYDLVRRHTDRFLAVAAVATTSFFVSAPLLQTAYSESLALLLLCLALRDLGTRSYGRTTLWALLLSLTRIVTPPLLLVVAVHLWLRWRRGDRPRRPEVLGLVSLTLVCLASPFLWSQIATSQRRPGEGISRATDVASWAVTWFGEAYGYMGVEGVFVMAVIAMGVLLLALSRTGRSMGPELSTWLWVYPFFLFAVTIIQPGMLRYLLLAPGLLVPLLGPVRRTKVTKWVVLAVVVVLLVVAQRWFIDTLLVIDSLDQGFGP